MPIDTFNEDELQPVVGTIPTPPTWITLNDYDPATGLPKKKSRSPTTFVDEFYNQRLSRLVPFRNGSHDGLIGIEIECEGKNLTKDLLSYWLCKEDHSLRHIDEHRPVEYVLKKPLSLEDTTRALKYLERKLQKHGSSVVDSNRTSVHVHFNCQDYTVRQLYNFILLYLIFEEMLIDWVSPERAGNLFCLRARDSDFYINMLEESLRKESLSFWRDEYRYSACNIASINKFGSLEFRALKGTVDINLILTWIKVLMHIRTKASNFDNPIQIVESFNELGPLPFFHNIFDVASLRDLFRGQHRLSSKLWDGVRMVRDVAYIPGEWKQPIKKNEQEENQEPLKCRWKKGDVWHYPNGLSYLVITGTGGPYAFEDPYTGETFTKTCEPGMVMYYTQLPNTFRRNLLDYREGPVEERW